MAEDYRLPGLPRYLRVNTLKIGLGKAKKNLLQTGHHLCPDPKHPGHRAYYRDKDVPDLLVFKPKGQSDISRIPMVASGEVVVQQKASCFPAVALDPPIGGVVIDACAAPGNKTSHVAALMQNKGTVFAFEQNERRAQLLREMMVLKGATIVQTKHMSFLNADPMTLRTGCDAHYARPIVLVVGDELHAEADPARLQALADDQTQLVLHAMKFPSVVAVCYSTCSVHELENEEVVRRILRGQTDFELAPAMPWERRGHVLKPDGGKGAERVVQDIAKHVLRTSYPDDQTIGFFLARFERKSWVARGRPKVTMETEEATAESEDHLAEGSGQMGSLEAKLVALAKARKKEEKAKSKAPTTVQSRKESPPQKKCEPVTKEQQQEEEQKEPLSSKSRSTDAGDEAVQESGAKSKRGSSRQRKRKREQEAKANAIVNSV